MFVMFLAQKIVYGVELLRTTTDYVVRSRSAVVVGVVIVVLELCKTTAVVCRTSFSRGNLDIKFL